MSEKKPHSEEINFDSDWEYCCLEQTNNIDDPSFLSNSVNDSQWISVSLPHLVKKDSKMTNPSKWWYRKQFSWPFSDQTSDEEKEIFLVFESTNNEDQFDSSSITGSIWFNGKEIASNALLSQSKSIELTSNLIERKQTNFLIISCENQSFSLHAGLMIEKKPMFTLEKHPIDNDKNINCTVHLNNTDGRINIQFDNFNEEFKRDFPSQSKNNSFDEKSMEDETIPRLAIVILIVGTRGDVQSFIAYVHNNLSFKK